MSDYLSVPPGFVVMHDVDADGNPIGTKFTVTPENYVDLYNFLQPQLDPTETGLIEITGDMSRMIKVYGFEQYPANPEVPVSARRYETDWTVIAGNDLGNGAGVPLEIPHKLSARMQDMIGYVLVSVTDEAGVAAGDSAFPMTNAAQVMVYPYINSNNGFQFEANSSQQVSAFVADGGIEFYVNGTLRNTAIADPSLIQAGATAVVVKFALYKIEHVYDFKDDRLITKVENYWYNHKPAAEALFTQSLSYFPPNPAFGAEVWRTDLDAFFKYNGSAWLEL